jgi:hypothetical protein
VNLGLGLSLSSARSVASGGTSYSAEATALFARMSTQPDDTRKGLINTFIVGLTTASLWTKLDALYVFAAGDTQAALLNWKGATFDASEVGSPVFTADRGYASAAGAYIDSNMAQNVGGTQYTQHAGVFGCYNNVAGTDGQYLMGLVTNGSTRVIPKTALGGGNWRQNTGTTVTIPDGTVASRVGAWSVVRENSTTQTIRQNGAQIHSGAANSTALIAENFVFLRASGADGSGRVATGIIGAFTGAEEATYRGLELTFLTAIGAN